MYESYRNAAQTVQELEVAGILRCDISILTSHFVDRGTNGMTPDRLELTAIAGRSRAGEGYAVSPTIAAGMGLLSELGALTILDIGPVVAAGWLASSAGVPAAGAATSGLIRVLAGSGITERRAILYANGVRRGATLVAVRSEGMHHASTEAIMRRHGPIDPEVYDMTYRYGSIGELPSNYSGTGYQTDGDLRATDAARPSGVGIFRT
jgi:hypothetical protein